MAKTEKQKWKEKAWSWFSKYIRKRDSLGDVFMCCSCGKVYPIKGAQAGHFIPGRNNAVLFEENGVHAQCYSCNMHKSGNWPGYYEFMLEEYGQIEIDRQLSQRNKIIKYTASDYQEIAMKYKDKYEALEET